MANLTTTYLDLNLKNPIVVSPSTLTEEIDNLRRMEDAGAAAIVLYSLFEEQVELQEMGYEKYYDQHPQALPKALKHVASMKEFRAGASEYLAYLYQAKKAVAIPIIASLNGYYSSGWIQYARLLEATGADALELNVYYLATQPQITGSDVERMYLDLVRNVKNTVNIPVAVKLSPYFSAFANIAHALDEAGADGLVVFNRFYQPDFDIEEAQVTSTLDLSTPAELRLRLRWVAMLYGRIQADMAITGGVHSAKEVIKSLMAGASVAMMTSALYKYGIGHISTVLAELESWLQAHEYAAVDDLRGRLSTQHAGDVDLAAFARANYLKVLKSYKGE